LNLSVTVYERGRIGEHLHRWGHARLFTSFGMNTTAQGQAAIRDENPRQRFPASGDLITGHEHLECYLEPLSRCASLREKVRTGIQVVQIGRHGFLREEATGEVRRGQQPFRLLLRAGDGREENAEADVVLDCTGTYAQHRWMGNGGIPAVGEIAAEPHVAYGLEDILGSRRKEYADRSILLVGSDHLAALSVCSLADLAEEHPETWVVWLARGKSSQPMRRLSSDPLKERDRLAVRANTLATRGEGNVEFHSQAEVETVEWGGPDKGFRVTAYCADRSRTFQVDRIIANVGYMPDLSLSRELHVHVEQLGAVRQEEHHFFVLGAKSYGRCSGFLMRTGFEQVSEVFSLILQGRSARS
jgi:hypothetical protein